MRWLLVLRAAGPQVLLRRRCCSGPVLLLLGVALCLCYQTLMSARNRLRSDGPGPAHVGGRTSPGDVARETGALIEMLERFHGNAQVASQNPSWRRRRRRAVVLTGGQQVWDTQVQLYQQVLMQLHFQVQTSTYAETSGLLRDSGESGWSLLLCLRGAEQSCLRRVSFSGLQRHQMVNLIPGLVEAFSDAGSGLCHMFTWSQPTDLPMSPFSCRPTNHRLPETQGSRAGAPPPGPAAVVKVCVLVTSLRPLTSFLHHVVMVTTDREETQRPAKLREFLVRQLGPEISHQALRQMKHAIGDVLRAAASTNEKTGRADRCVWCFQLLTFTLTLSSSVSPVVVQVDTDVTFSALTDSFDGQISRDLILEDTLHFLFSSETQGDVRQSRGCKESHDLCLSEEDLFLLLQFHRRMVTAPPAFLPLFPSTSSCLSLSSRPLSVSDHMTRISCYHLLQSNTSSREALTNQEAAVRSHGQASGRCVDPRLRQIYSDPPLSLTPPFDPQVKEYRAEVTFDTVTVRLRPLTVSSSCAAHLDEHRGPRMANYPVGLGNSRISILVTDDAEADPVVMTIYTIHVFRENRPSLPTFGDHVTCGFVQDCGLRLRPSDSCGLHPLNMSTGPLDTCPSGHQPGRWVVPCLSCSDNRTCDWREVAWRPDSCSHVRVQRPLLQACMRNRKVLFIGDSTNRGMMYFLMERVNGSLDDWVKGHDLLVYRNLNAGRTQVSYSYYPQFWLDQAQRPTFKQALQQLLHRSRPLVNSNLTVLVVGGVQWLNTNHLRTISEVLDRERLSNILVAVKTLGMGFHLPVDGIRSLSLRELQRLDKDNSDIIATAKDHGYEVIDTFSITMGRYKEFLQGRCACHFHEVETFRDANRSTSSSPGLRGQSDAQHDEQGAEPDVFTYHVRGSVNKVYSEILLSRLCHTHT